MPSYTIVITALDGHQHTTVADFPDDTLALAEAGRILTPKHRSVAVARGTGAALEFIGAWDLDEVAARRWTPED